MNKTITSNYEESKRENEGIKTTAAYEYSLCGSIAAVTEINAKKVKPKQ